MDAIDKPLEENLLDDSSTDGQDSADLGDTMKLSPERLSDFAETPKETEKEGGSMELRGEKNEEKEMRVTHPANALTLAQREDQ
jgi:hypothetical protein